MPVSDANGAGWRRSAWRPLDPQAPDVLAISPALHDEDRPRGISFAVGAVPPSQVLEAGVDLDLAEARELEGRLQRAICDRRVVAGYEGAAIGEAPVQHSEGIGENTAKISGHLRDRWMPKR